MYYGITDFETTGLKPHYHEPVVVSILVVDQNLQVKGKFKTGIRPAHWDRIDPIALEINKLTVEELKLFPQKIKARSLFLEWWGQAMEQVKLIPVAHGWGFDKEFARDFLETWFSEIYHYQAVDTQAILNGLKMMNLFPEDMSIKLENLTEEFEIPHKPHEAHSDCYAVLELIRRLEVSLQFNIKYMKE